MKFIKIRGIRLAIENCAPGFIPNSPEIACDVEKLESANWPRVCKTVPAASWMYPGDGYGGMAYYDPVWDEEALAGARAYVDGVVARLRAADVEADGAARQERLVAESIVQAADAAESDLIVMSTRALTGPARAILGSTADAVVRAAHCPVLLIHRQEAAGEVFSEFAPEAIAVAPL